MPTRFCPTLLLALAAACVSADVGVGAEAIVPRNEFARIRPGVSSSGPQGMRRVDSNVEPATFHSLGLSAPLSPPKSVVDNALQATKDPKVSELIVSNPAPAPEESVRLPTESVAEPVTLTPPTSAEPLPLAMKPERATNQPDSLNVAAPPDASPGRLLLGAPADDKPSQPRHGASSNPLDAVMNWRPSSQQMTATGAGLAITVGLLLSFIWLVRSMAPKASRPLPREVVEVLGRTPLGSKQMTQLVRVGHKLVLIAITPDGAETLTEITDPEEVARLVAACDSSGGRGSTAEFDAMLRQMESERTRPGFLDTSDNHRYDDAAFDPRSLAAAYANTPGGRGDG
ncbi:FliO/MopB family protein [Botrimarina mediterranea]|uniref:FliO/MopB family protein n=1 Tax=Botrimarina mediterranea TaxID=2528022 RepID=UPI00118B64A3|nr:Flagellar biosynthesis protein, FliO [Planctomycetes bacterium K2D]